MALHSKGDRELSGFEKALFNARAWLRQSLVSEAVIEDKSYRSIFQCENRLEAYRALSLWIKETGTMTWLDQGLKAGDRFLDIGANIGIYTIAAAHRVGPQGRVFAVEPHKANAVSLMRNILRNGFENRVEVLAFPVSDARMFAKFNYTSLGASETGSQFGSTRLDNSNKEFKPAASELCLGVTVDELVEQGAIEAPALVKIDVDGIELKILKGMQGLLAAPHKPRSVQVELNVGEHEAVIEFMAANGYALDHRHFTLLGQRMRDAGKDINTIAHNAVFAPRTN
jgi:FkbM family methyltransferase